MPAVAPVPGDTEHVTTPADGSTNEFGATWCAEHNRWECSKKTKRENVRCHRSAMAGLDNCGRNGHPGMSMEAAKAKGQAAVTRARFRDVEPGEYVDPGSVLAWAVTVAFIDIADYRAELAAQAADGKTLGEQALDRLTRMQTDVARISKLALDAGVNERAIKIAEDTAATLVTVIRGVLADLGHDTGDPEVQAVVRRRLELVAPAAS
jgi:hypothetical protein